MEADRRNWIGLDLILKDETSTQKEGDALDSVQVYRIQTVLLIPIASYKDKHVQMDESKKRTKENEGKPKQMMSCPCSRIDDCKRLRTNEGG